MIIHWPSFLLGLAALPLAIAVALVLGRLFELLRGRAGRVQSSRPAPGLSGPEPLRFTPRLIGQLRRPLGTEDQAQAS